MRILFIAGFGPIVRDLEASRNLYGKVLGIPFKEEKGGYLHTEALNGARAFLCGHSPKRRSLASVAACGRTICPHPTLGLSSMLMMSKAPLLNLNRWDIECLSRTRRNHGVRL